MRFVKKINFQEPQVVILFASYEERSVQVAKELSALGYSGETRIFYCRELQTPSIQANVNAIEHILKGKTKAIPVSYHDPVPMIRSLSHTNKPNSVLIDISCFNRGNLYPFLWAIELGKKWFPEITFAYSPPNNYGAWLSRDYETPQNIVGFAGGQGFKKERLLICIVGYEVERALAVIKTIEPSKVILTVGKKPTKEDFFERNRLAVEEVLGSNNYEIISINVSSPEESFQNMNEMLRNVSPETAIHFAPFSTKLSCLGVWAVWLQNPHIRIWNAQPKIYNVLNYSKGSAAPCYFGIEW